MDHSGTLSVIVQLVNTETYLKVRSVRINNNVHVCVCYLSFDMGAINGAYQLIPTSQ